MTCLSIIGLSPQKLNVLCLPLSHVIDFLSACYDSLKSCGTFEVRCVRSLQNGLLDRDGSPLTKSDGRNRKGTFEERFVKVRHRRFVLTCFLLVLLSVSFDSDKRCRIKKIVVEAYSAVTPEPFSSSGLTRLFSSILRNYLLEFFQGFKRLQRANNIAI